MPNQLDEIESLYRNDEANAWTPDPEHVAKLALPNISQSAPGLMNEPDRDTFLWRYMDAAMQKRKAGWKYQPQFQKQGTCGGQSGKNSWDIATAFSSVAYNTVFPGRCSVAGMYAGSRVDIAQQPGKWQGTCGCWVADFGSKFGGVLLQDLNIDENYYYAQGMDPDETLAMQWANSYEGVPQKYEQLAKVHPLGSIAQPRNAREAGKLIQKGFPCIVGCDLIPTGRRDSSGFSQLQKMSGHLTSFIAVRYNPFGLLYLNSWGLDWAKGPVMVEDQWPCTVWLDESSCDAMIRQGDTFGFGSTKGLAEIYTPAFKQAS